MTLYIAPLLPLMIIFGYMGRCFESKEILIVTGISIIFASITDPFLVGSLPGADRWVTGVVIEMAGFWASYLFFRWRYLNAEESQTQTACPYPQSVQNDFGLIRFGDGLL